MSFRDSRSGPFIASLIAYGIAFLVAWGVWAALPGWDILLRTLVADIAATVVIWVSGLLLRNSSMYDPYWSVAPIVIAFVWISHAVLPFNDTRAFIVASLVSLWGVRLTYNCFRRWKSLRDVDFRYLDLKEKSGRLYPLVDLLGIQVFPTLLVFLGCLSLYPSLALSAAPLNVFDLLAFFVTVGAIAIETMADQQLRAFLRVRASESEVLRRGLWAWSRHPNYFGEISFWWGLWIFAMAADPSWWWTIIGPLAMTALFAFVSIPMMQERKKHRRPDYEEQVRGVSVLIPRPPRQG